MFKNYKSAFFLMTCILTTNANSALTDTLTVTVPNTPLKLHQSNSSEAAISGDMQLLSTVDVSNMSNSRSGAGNNVLTWGSDVSLSGANVYTTWNGKSFGAADTISHTCPSGQCLLVRAAPNSNLYIGAEISLNIVNNSTGQLNGASKSINQVAYSESASDLKSYGNLTNISGEGTIAVTSLKYYLYSKGLSQSSGTVTVSIPDIVVIAADAGSSNKIYSNIKVNPFPVNIVPSTCKFEGAASTGKDDVTMPELDFINLQNANVNEVVAGYSGNVDWTLNCERGLKPKIVFTDNLSKGNKSSILTLGESKNGYPKAEGVGYQITSSSISSSSNTPIELDKQYELVDAELIEDKNIPINLIIDYVKTSSIISSGEANAVVNVGIIYN